MMNWKWDLWPGPMQSKRRLAIRKAQPVPLADGLFIVPDEIREAVLARTMPTPAHPGRRPLFSGEVKVFFGVDPEPSVLEEAPVAQAAAVRPRRPNVPNVPGGDSLYLKLKGLWNDPGSGRFVKRGRSTAKAQAMMFEPGDAVREVARGRGRVRARVADNRMSRSNIRKGDVIEVSFKDDEFAVVEVVSASGKKRKYDVKWARFDEVVEDTPVQQQVPEPNIDWEGHTAEKEVLWHNPGRDPAVATPDVDPSTWTREGSRWGHGGTFFTPEDRSDTWEWKPGMPPPTKMRPIKADGEPFRLFEVNDDQHNGGTIISGQSDDPEWNAFVQYVAAKYGVEPTGITPAGNPYWDITFKTNQELRGYLRDELEARGFDGWWTGGEIVVWNYDKISGWAYDINADPMATLREREIAKHNAALRKSWTESLASNQERNWDNPDWNGQPINSVDDIVAAARFTRDNGKDRIAVQVPLDVLPALARDGRFKSQFESKKSKGAYAPEWRITAERDVLDVPEDTPDDQRPIYGFLEPHGDTITPAAYGDVALRLKPELADRTTVMFGDSLKAGGGRAVPLTGDVTDEELVAAFDRNGFIPPPYTEAQIRGGVSLDDVTAVVIPLNPKTSPDFVLRRYAENPLPGKPVVLGQGVVVDDATGIKQDTLRLAADAGLTVTAYDGTVLAAATLMGADDTTFLADLKAQEADILRIAVEDGGGDFPDCLVASEEINKRFGLPVEQGFFYSSEPGAAYNKMNWGPHAWVRLPDGSILDLTSNQFSGGAGPGIQVIRPGDPSYGRYWTEGKGMWETRKPENPLGWLQAGGVDVVEAPPLVRGTATKEWFDSTIGSQPWYHVTGFDRAAAILANGLDPSYGGLQSDATAPPRPGAVYLAHKTMVDAGLAGNPMAELLDIDRPVTLEFDTSKLDYRRVVPDEDYFTIAEWEKPEAYGLPAWEPTVETSGAWAQRVGLGEQPGIVEKVVGQDNRFAYGKPVPAAAIKRVRFDAYFDEDGTLVPASDWLTPEQALRVLSGEDVTPDAVGVEDTPDVVVPDGDATVQTPAVPGPRHPIVRGRPPEVEFTPTKEQITDAFTIDLGDGYASKVKSVKKNGTGDGYWLIDGTITYNNRKVGEWQRATYPSGRVQAWHLYLDKKHHGKGIGTKFTDESSARLADLGAVTLTTKAKTDLLEGDFGAYVWARDGYDWDPGVSPTETGLVEALRGTIDSPELPDGILSDEDRAAALAMADRLDEWNPWVGDRPEGYPTPNDVAMLGWKPGAETWFGKQFLTGELLKYQQSELGRIGVSNRLLWSGRRRIDKQPEAPTSAPSTLRSSRLVAPKQRANDGMPSTTNITPVSRDELNDDEVLKQSWRQPFAEDNRRLSRERGQARMDGFRRAPIVIGAKQAEYSKGDGYLMRQGIGAVFASPGYRFPELPDDDAVNPDGFGYVLGPSALQDVVIRPNGSLPPEIGLTDPAPSDDLLIQMGWHDGETSALYRGKMPPDDIRGIVLLTGTAPIAARPTESGGEPRWRMRDSAYPAYEGTGGWDTSNEPIDYAMLPGDTVFLTAVQATDNPEQTRREMALAAAAGKDMKVLRHNGDIVEVEQVLADYESAKVTTPDDWTGPSPLAPEGNEGNRHAEYVRRVFDDAGLSQPGRAPYTFSRSHDWYEGGRAHAEDADGFVAEMREVRQGAAERMAIRVPLEVIPKIIADGRLMNQHESKQSEGTLDPRQRKDAERLLFGIPTRGGKVQDRPIYGLVETPDYRDGSQYGKFVLSLKPETARRTTMTFGDSLGVANATYGYKTEDGVRKSKKKDEPDLRGAHGAAIPMTGDVTDEQILGATQSNGSNRAYIEIQVHGGVSLDDVRSVRYSPWIQNDDQTRADLLEYAKNPLPGLTLELPQDVYDVAGPEVLDALTGAGVTVVAVPATGGAL